MINVHILVSVVSVGLLFILFITEAYNKSISTAINIVSLAIAMQLYIAKYCNEAIIVVVLGAIISLGRAVLTHEKDRWLKRD